ncbi:MAG: RNA polymerase sporulation sigma factor SigG [Clostridiales bacterium]
MLNKVELCGVNTSKLPVLSNEVMRKLFAAMQQKGDQNARQEIISGNLRLVLSVIQRFNNRGENPDDLFQVGCIGLIKATDNFDLSQNVRFSTYAVPMIIGEIRRYIRDNNSIRVSRSLRDIAYKTLQTRDAIIRQKGKEPTMEEIAKELDIPLEDITFALDAIQEPISLFEPVYHDGTDQVFIMDQLGDEKNGDHQWLEMINIQDGLDKLNEREKNIINLRFFAGKTQMEVAQEIGISQAQVSRLEKGALHHLKKYM